MKTIIILFILFPILAHALRKLYLYVVHFQENKCSGCAYADKSFKKAACGSCAVSSLQKK